MAPFLLRISSLFPLLFVALAFAVPFLGSLDQALFTFARNLVNFVNRAAVSRATRCRRPSVPRTVPNCLMSYLLSPSAIHRHRDGIHHVGLFAFTGYSKRPTTAIYHRPPVVERMLHATCFSIQVDSCGLGKISGTVRTENRGCYLISVQT